MSADLRRVRAANATDPDVGMTLDELAEFVAECMGHYELPGNTPVRATGMIEFNLQHGPRIARISADPTLLTETSET